MKYCKEYEKNGYTCNEQCSYCKYYDKWQKLKTKNSETKKTRHSNRNTNHSSLNSNNTTPKM